MKIDLGKLRGNPEAPLLVVDLLMVLLVLFNLAWIVFNSLFSSHLFQSGVAALSPAFHVWYRDRIHPDFADYDMIFVTIYVVELLLRWAIAIIRRTYHRWFFYPFVHWYDVLGCIPVGSFRWLRILRVVALLWRLQQQGIIDLRDSALFRTLRKYLDIVTEEIADRVVINVIDGLHGELARGNPVVHRIGREVLAPRRAELIAWLAGRLREAAGQVRASRQAELNAYVARVVAEGMDASPDVQRLQRLPVAGPLVGEALDGAVTDIATHIVDRLLRDLASPERLESALNTLADLLGQDSEALSRLLQEVLLESLTIVRDQVGVQQWKVREARGHYD
ncbi:MAG: ion transporter [Pseudomonadota bacterium]